jgi:Uma2 family endonuclease
VFYPESDGKPMAETDLHRDEMFDLIATLKGRYATAADVYVSGNLLMYYEKGNPRAAVAPDVFVVFGAPKEPRRSYKLWEEHVAPAVVFEITSRSTRREDLFDKQAVYGRLGVGEYFLYDPDAEYLKPPLKGFRLDGGTYRRLVPDATDALRSEALGMDLRLSEGRLVLFDAASGERLLRPAERLARAEAELARLQAETLRRQGLPDAG